MTIFIFGGSNSLMKHGWVKGFTQLFPEGEVVNASVGTNTTHMGLFQLLRTPGMKAGDTVIWEYALNEQNHVARGRNLTAIQECREHLIRHCQREGLRLVMAIFKNRRIEPREQPTPSYIRLERLITHYNLTSYDLSQHWQSTHDGNTIPPERYADADHYLYDDEMVDFIAKGIFDAVSEARVPAEAAPRVIGARVKVVLETPRPSIPFQNSVLSLGLLDPKHNDHVIGHDGRILALYAMSYRDSGSALHIGFGPKRHADFSTHSGDQKVAATFRSFNPIDLVKTHWPCRKGEVLKIRPITTAGTYAGDGEIIRQVDEFLIPPRPSFAGLLIETPMTDDPARPAPRADKATLTTSAKPSPVARLLSLSRRILSKLKG